MLWLVLAALLWLAIHLGVSGTKLRESVAGLVGPSRFAGVFSLAAAVALGLLIYAFTQADPVPLWFAPPWLVGVIDAAMLLALLLLAASVIPPRGVGEGPRGIFRVSRHPMMAALAIWSGAHILANGTLAAMVFFGAFLVTVLAGVPSLDAKLARRDPAKAAAVQAVTSRVPFAAILAGRNRLALAEIGWLPFAAGLVGWVALLHLHPLLFGVPALPQ